MENKFLFTLTFWSTLLLALDMVILFASIRIDKVKVAWLIALGSSFISFVLGAICIIRIFKAFGTFGVENILATHRLLGPVPALLVVGFAAMFVSFLAVVIAKSDYLDKHLQIID